MFSKLLALTTVLSLVNFAVAAVNQLQQVTNFGNNPTNVKMYLYKPPKLANPTPLIVAMHYCSGTAQAYFSGTQWANLADKHGYYVIFPNAPDSGGCWDVHSDNTLKHDAGGDSLGIANMARYAIKTYGVSPDLVFMGGLSSGAMMTNVLAGAYPDLFKGGVAFAGVPYSCFAGAGMWNSQCSGGTLTKTAQQWGDAVRAGYPGFTGTRPKLMLWHGTNDETLNYRNLAEAVKQWTNVLGLPSSPTSTQANTPSSPWTKSTYGANFITFSGAGLTHNIPQNEAEALNFFGLGNTVPGDGPAGPTTGPPTQTTVAPPPPPSQTGQPQWAQCGGIGWPGSTTCQSPFTCKYVNDWYYQCV